MTATTKWVVSPKCSVEGVARNRDTNDGRDRDRGRDVQCSDGPHAMAGRVHRHDVDGKVAAEEGCRGERRRSH